MEKIVCIVGLGELGSKLLEKLSKKYAVRGVDTDKQKSHSLKLRGYKVSNKPVSSNVYIITVYNTRDVLNAIKSLDYSNKPLVVIESTVKPGTYKRIKDFKSQNKLSFDLVFFPHRYNANDLKHQLFNLDRVMGGSTKDAIERAINFYSPFMNKNLIHIFPIEIVELSKPLENAYRFYEIAFAEETKMLCDKKKINFKKLRAAMNTKWNINIKEAREGIDGKCLPKDTHIANNFFEENRLINEAIAVDKEYKKYLKQILRKVTY